MFNVFNFVLSVCNQKNIDYAIHRFASANGISKNDIYAELKVKFKLHTVQLGKNICSIIKNTVL